jgi:hypothetical protein
VLDRVILVAAYQRAPIHHVTIPQIVGAKSVSFDDLSLLSVAQSRSAADLHR